MKVLFWESDSEELISRLQGHGDGFHYLGISSWEELEESLKSPEMSIVIIDIDDKFDSILSIAQKLQEQFSHCPLLLSFQSLVPKQLKQLQQKAPEVDGFLKRPHEPAKLHEMIQDYASRLLKDHPADMKQGGTEEIDVDATLNSLNQQGEEQEEGTKFLEAYGDEKTSISFGDSGTEEGQGDGKERPPSDNLGPTKGVEIDISSQVSFETKDEQSPGRDATKVFEAHGDESTSVSFSYDGTEEGQGDGKEGPPSDDLGPTKGVDLDISSQVSFETKDEQSPGRDATKVFEAHGDESTSISFSYDGTEEGQGDEKERSPSDDLAPTEGGEIDISSQVSFETKDEQSPESGGKADEDQGGESSLILTGAQGAGSSEEESIGTDLNPPSLTNITELKKESESISQHHSDELLRLKASIQNLREDRGRLVKKLEDWEKEGHESSYKLNTLQAELDEVKIELIFLKKRYGKEVDDLKYTTKLAQEKRDILMEKNKRLKQEVEVVRGRVKFDTLKIQEREKELESQLELLKMDSENLLKNRDKKILELKRKIDTLEFDFETILEREKRTKEDKSLLEDRLERIMGSLRRTVGNLDEDLLAEKGEDQDKKLTEL